MKIEVTPSERTVIVAALMSYHFRILANKIAAQDATDSADDGPEVNILRAPLVLDYNELKNAFVNGPSNKPLLRDARPDDITCFICCAKPGIFCQNTDTGVPCKYHNTRIHDAARSPQVKA